MDCLNIFFKYIFYIYSYYLKKFQQTWGHGPLSIDNYYLFIIKVVKCFWGLFLLFSCEFIMSYDTLLCLRVIDLLYIFKVKLVLSRTVSSMVVLSSGMTDYKCFLSVCYSLQDIFSPNTFRCILVQRVQVFFSTRLNDRNFCLGGLTLINLRNFFFFWATQTKKIN